MTSLDEAPTDVPVERHRARNSQTQSRLGGPGPDERGTHVVGLSIESRQRRRLLGSHQLPLGTLDERDAPRGVRGARRLRVPAGLQALEGVGVDRAQHPEPGACRGAVDGHERPVDERAEQVEHVGRRHWCAGADCLGGR